MLKLETIAEEELVQRRLSLWCVHPAAPAAVWLRVQSVVRMVPALSCLTCAILSRAAAGLLRPLFVPEICAGAGFAQLGVGGT